MAVCPSDHNELNSTSINMTSHHHFNSWMWFFVGGILAFILFSNPAGNELEVGFNISTLLGVMALGAFYVAIQEALGTGDAAQ